MRALWLCILKKLNFDYLRNFVDYSMARFINTEPQIKVTSSQCTYLKIW